MSTPYGTRIEGQGLIDPGRPFYVREHAEFAEMDPDDRVAWFTDRANEAIAVGAKYIRYSIDHPTRPTRGLVEAWQVVLDPYRMPPTAWPRRAPATPGEYSACEDCHRLADPPTPRQEATP
jgi:hypothetical protein